jgi:ABC-2 type transport system ATP-binding protein
VYSATVVGMKASLDVEPGAIGEVIAYLTPYGIRDLTSRPPTLEELFMRHYEGSSEASDERSAAAAAQRAVPVR